MKSSAVVIIDLETVGNLILVTAAQNMIIITCKLLGNATDEFPCYLFKAFFVAEADNVIIPWLLFLFACTWLRP